MRTLTDGSTRTVSPDAPVARPYKLAHLVIRTGRLAEMRAFYLDVLGAEVVSEHEGLFCGMTYDEEHHRLALVAIPEAPAADRSETFSAGVLNDNKDTDLGDIAFSTAPGLEHVAFTYATLAELVHTYVRLREHGIVPAFSVNHGPTVSLYYEDPDANKVELQIDSMTLDAADEYLRSELAQANVIGWPFDPEELVRRFEAGEPINELAVGIGKPVDA